MTFAALLSRAVAHAVSALQLRARRREHGGARAARRTCWLGIAEALEPRRMLSTTPVVLSINRAAPIAPNTGAVSVSYTATFNEAVTGVDPTDFRLFTGGSLTIGAAPAVTGNGALYTITIGSLRGSGNLRLDLVDDDTISAGGVPLGGTGAHNGSFQGQTYDILQVFPQVLSINRTTPSTPTTSAGSVAYTVTFSEAVTGVDASDFQVTSNGSLTHGAPAVSGSGSVYGVSIGALTGSGTLGLNLVDNGSIHDANGRPLTVAGTPSFAAPTPVISGSTLSSFASADFNGDGKLDLAVANHDGKVISILLGNGDGTFQSPRTIATAGTPNGIIATDVNGDGRADLVFISDSNATLTVQLGNGDGTFKAPTTFSTAFPSGSEPTFLTSADVNSDGQPDLILIVISSTYGTQTQIFLGKGDGTFSRQSTLFVGGSQLSSEVAADFNGDGKPDLATVGGGSGSQGHVDVYAGQPNGGFQAIASYAASGSSILATDVNSDGKIDLVLAGDETVANPGNGPSDQGAVTVLLGNGDGTFQAPATFAASFDATGASSASSADLNLDGKPDVLVSSSGAVAADVLLGNADGTYSDFTTFAPNQSANPSTMPISADVNNDGMPDLIVSYGPSSNTEGIGVLLNTSTGSFTGQEYYVSPQPLVSAHYDFGTATSPVQSGYTRVSDGTTFSSALGYGWLTAPAGSRDRGAVSGTTALTQDFDFVNSSGSTFAVNVPNGAYNVTVTMGDATTKRDDEGVFLDGAQVDTVTTAAGQFYVKTYPVTVNNGQLTLLLKDLGGTDGFAVINGLDIVPAAYTADYDFGTPTSPVAAGTVGVNETTNYNPQQGYGWLAPPGGSIDQGNPDVPITTTDLTRDYDYAALGGSTFAVDLPNGTYNVTVTMGDATALHFEESLSFNGVSYDRAIATNYDRWLVTTYSVVIANGQLDLRLNPNTGSTDMTASYSAAAEINGLDIVPATFTAHYDFGPATSPTAAGTAPVSESTTYSTAQGYGWLTAPLGSRDRGGIVGTTAITRDWDYTGSTGATFAVNLPNGNYDVTVTMGDATTAHDDQGVFVQGAQVASVNTAAGQYISQMFPAAVTNGQLTVGIKDLGGSDPNAVIDGLDIATVLPGGNFDFGTPTSPVIAGAIGVSEQTLYTAQQGYGWLDAPVGSRDRGALAGTTALTQDFDFTDGPSTDGTGSTFLVDLPNGNYNVTVTMGDATHFRDGEGVYLQGALVDTVNTAANQYFVKTYSVAVLNGQLRLTLMDLGTNNPHDYFTVINGLNIVAA